MAKDPVKRKSFVSSSLQFILEHNFDGLDLDWEYPGKRGGAPEDKDNFISLIQDLHSVYSKHKLLLTAAIGAAIDTIDAAYDVEKMYKYLVRSKQSVIRVLKTSLSGFCARDVLRLPWQMG